MKLVGLWQDALIDVSVDADLTAELNLGRECSFVLIEVPTMDSCDIKLEAARTSGGTYYKKDIKGVGTGQIMIKMLLGGFQFIKIGTSVVQTSNRTLKVIGG
ncbi:hypothetical protein KJ781_04970 [Patescibacteria group bacterium]|uniref:Uncharacterized protein n=1 Tax=viral metagenome TaxID=1070528 RepID=A0A6H1ZMW5_9ZZZZ|nr:hypothetical protein [Patescibacteria group bacterium]